MKRKPWKAWGAARILRMLRDTGRRKRSVIDKLAGGPELLDRLLKQGKVRMVGSKRGAQYEATP
jgi:hypothetical protein